MPKIGDEIVFVPVAFTEFRDLDSAPLRLLGRVVAVNERHRHYTVEAELYGYKLRETYKF